MNAALDPPLQLQELLLIEALEQAHNASGSCRGCRLLSTATPAMLSAGMWCLRPVRLFSFLAVAACRKHPESERLLQVFPFSP